MSVQTRIDLAERQLAQRNWENYDVVRKAEVITRHYVTHAALCQQLNRILQGPINQDGLVLIEHQLNILIKNHIKDFGVDPAWNW